MSSTHLVVSLHDVHPGSFDLIREQVAFCESLGVSSLSLLVVPNYHQQGEWSDSSELVGWLKNRQQKGDEIVLHGYFHHRVNQTDSYRNLFWTKLYTQNEAEFLDLEETEAEKRIKQGLSSLETFGFFPSGFIAPAWLMSAGTVRAIFKANFNYTNTLTHLIVNPSLVGKNINKIASQSLCYSTRATWRRLASLVWNQSLANRLIKQPLIRLSLHPRDLTFPSLRKQIEKIVKGFLNLGVIPISYEKWIKQEIIARGQM